LYFLHTGEFSHIDWHLDRGLAVVMAENIPDKLRKEHPPGELNYVCKLLSFLIRIVNELTAAWDELCGIFDALPPHEFHV
jgi:hypothetical protein